MTTERQAIPETRLSVSSLHLVFYEIIAVTTAMRRNSRWASAQPGLSRGTSLASSMGLRAPTGGNEIANHAGQNKHEVALMVGFDELKRTLQDTDDVLSLPLTTILAPFLAIIRSPLSTGPITSTALSSLLNFLVSGVISPTSVDVSPALITLSNALAHCKFERSDSAGDEVVLLRIVNVIDECQASDVGALLGDVEVCEMLETVLTVCCQMRLSETLRRCAESAMYAMVRRVFSRLNELDPAIDPEGAEEPQASTPYGLPSAQELVRVLVNLLDPSDQQHTDSIRLTILGILNAALERSGAQIAKFYSLSGILQDNGCKFLFQLARSENPTVLRLALRVISTLFHTMGEHLKLQTELFLSFSVDRLAPPTYAVLPKLQLSLNSVGQNRRNASLPGTPNPDSSFTNGVGDPLTEPLLLEGGSKEEPPPPTRPGIIPAKGLSRELLLETVGYLARQPTFMVDMWVNYDCDVDCEDLFERLITFFTRGVYTTHYTGSLESQRYAAQLVCLDVLLSYVNNLATRAETPTVEWPEIFPEPKTLADRKAIKGLLITGATRFKAKPKTGLAFLEENGLIYKPADQDAPRAQTLARFLKSTPRLDKKVLGEWISSPDQIEVLREFIGLFDFSGKSVADAMRLLLEAFRLPGEAMPIARITETFADIYFDSHPPEVKSKDAVYVLSYSVIMLNTDLYNPQNTKRRMTLEEYQRNLRGVNDGEDFDPAYLTSIYESIKKREIILPEEHTGSLGFDHAWKALLLRTKNAGPLITCRTSLFDRAMFQLTWKPVISAIAYAFTAFDDDYVVERAIAGFRKCAILASHFQLPEVFDYVVRSLSHATGLLSDVDPKHSKFPVVQVEGQSLTVSPLSVRFGTNFRGQLAAVVLFTIANGNGNAIRDGWTLIFEMFQTLFAHSLLPPKLLQMEDFLGGTSAIPMQGAVPSPTAMNRPDGGLLSALSSYLLTPYGASSDSLAEPTQDDIENTLCTMDCVTSCKVDELYGQIVSLHVDALIAVMRALQTLADHRTVDILVDEIISDPADLPDTRADVVKEQLLYDPSSVFLLETMISLARQTKEHIEDTWPIVFEHLSGLLKASERFSVLLIERAVVGLLRLCLIIADKPDLRDQIYIAIDLLRGLPPSVMNSVAEQMAAGLAILLKEHDIMKSSTEWGLVLSLIRGTISHPGAAKTSFTLIQDLLAADKRQVVTADSVGGFVALLESFASAAGLAVEGKRQERRNAAPSAGLEPVVERGTKAVDMVYDLKKHVPRFIEQSSLPKEEAWANFWLIPLSALSRQSASSCREVRHSAIGHLQRILLGHQISANVPEPVDFALLCQRAVFPMMEDLLQPQVNARDPQGMPETRLRASTLLCKSFLHFSVRSAENVEQTGKLWLSILDILDRFMHSGRRDQLYEAVPESLKNVVLVMNASGILVRPLEGEQLNSEQLALWQATHERMELFLPGFLDELIPQPPPPSPPTVGPPTPEASPQPA